MMMNMLTCVTVVGKLERDAARCCAVAFELEACVF